MWWWTWRWIWSELLDLWAAPEKSKGEENLKKREAGTLGGLVARSNALEGAEWCGGGKRGTERFLTPSLRASLSTVAVEESGVVVVAGRM